MYCKLLDPLSFNLCGSGATSTVALRHQKGILIIMLREVLMLAGLNPVKLVVKESAVVP